MNEKKIRPDVDREMEYIREVNEALRTAVGQAVKNVGRTHMNRWGKDFFRTKDISDYLLNFYPDYQGLNIGKKTLTKWIRYHGYELKTVKLAAPSGKTICAWIPAKAEDRRL